jgi:hypothetical protein
MTSIMLLLAEKDYGVDEDATALSCKIPEL